MNCLTKLFQQKRRRIGYILAFSGPMISKRDSSDLENHFVWLAKYDFKVWFNIIKHKYVKEFHFCVIFLSKKFVLLMIIRIFAAREPAKPLNDAQMCGSFLFL